MNVEKPGHERDATATFTGQNDLQPLQEEMVIPLLAEQLVVGKRLVETGTVRLHVHTEEHVETVEAPLTEVRYTVEHIPVDRVVETAPAIRHEGETTIYPVLQERLVVRREIVLVEEVHVTRREIQTVDRQDHVLRREELTEERTPQQPIQDHFTTAE